MQNEDKIFELIVLKGQFIIRISCCNINELEQKIRIDNFRTAIVQNAECFCIRKINLVLKIRLMRPSFSIVLYINPNWEPTKKNFKYLKCSQENTSNTNNYSACLQWTDLLKDEVEDDIYYYITPHEQWDRNI